MRSAVSFAVSSGCLMVAAVGNEGSTQLDYPAAYPDVIGVGSVDVDDLHSGFSNHNSSVDLVAPGEFRGGTAGIPVVLPGDEFGYSTGTSIATPHVAGAALLVWADDPALTTQQVWEALRDNAQDLGDGGWDEYYGFGRLDVMEALARVEVTIQSPTPYTFEPTGYVTAYAREPALHRHPAPGTLRRRRPQGLLRRTGPLHAPSPAPSPAYDLPRLSGEGAPGGGQGLGYRRYQRFRHQPIIITTIPSRAPPTTWYLAEGTTAWGFDTWVLIQNPNPAPVTVNITYMKPTGPQVRAPLDLPGDSRTTIHLNAEVSPSDVSTYVESTGGEVIVERSMYWNDRQAGHDSIGVNAPSTTWYLAEGTTAWGFEEYLLVQNPNPGAGQTAHVTFDFMRPDGSAVTPYVMEVAPPPAAPSP